ncbi:hypothetical protein DRJ25_00205, partial [Candidatus Woesearchaeota archaeon]
MNKQIVHRDFAIFLFVISIVLAVFVSFNVFDVSESVGKITGRLSLGVQVNDSSAEVDAAYDSVFNESNESIENSTQQIEVNETLSDNLSLPDDLTDNPDSYDLTDPLNDSVEENLSVPDNETIPETAPLPENDTLDNVSRQTNDTFAYNFTIPENDSFRRNETASDNIIAPDNTSLAEDYPVHLNATPAENVSGNVSFPNNMSEPNKASFMPVISPGRKSVKELNSVLLSAFDHYCEDVSPFLKRCIIQTERDLCHLEGKEIVCAGILNTESYTDNLTTKQKQILSSKGVPIRISGKNTTKYFNPSTGTRFKVEWDNEKYIHIGFLSDTFVIEDFYYGTNEGNVSIDVGVELKPTDSEISLPQSNNIVGRWDFVINAGDTSGLGNDGTVNGATHTYERYNFDGVDDYIDAGNDGSLNFTENITVSAWVNLKDRYYDGGANKVLVIASKGAPWYYDTMGWTLYASWDQIIFKTSNSTSHFLARFLNYEINRWYHVVGVINSTNISLYVDGKLSQSTQIHGQIRNEDTPVLFGREKASTSGYHYLNGSIENVIIWNTTLTADEIEQVYNATRFNTSGNTQTYSGLFTGGVLDSGQSISEWSSLNWTSTEPTGTSIELRYRTGNYSKIDLTDSGLISYWNMNRSDSTNITGNSNIDNSQVLHLKFNSENDFTDYSGTGNDGTNSGSAYTDKGYIEGARSFDGTNDYVDLSPSQALNSSNLTISAWLYVKNSSNPSIQGIITDGGSGFPDTRLFIAGNKVDFWVGNTTTRTEIYSDNNIINNKWFHLVTTTEYVGGTTTTKMYIDGKLQSHTGSLPSKTVLGRDTLYIGWLNSNRFFNGLIDNVRIYNTSLNASQVKELYSKEAGTYDSKSDNHGTAYNDVNRDSGIFENDGALKFDGVDDYVDCGNDSLGITNQFTMCSWIYFNSVPSQGSPLGRKSTSSSSYDYLFYVSSGNLHQFYVVNTSGSVGIANGDTCLTYLKEWRFHCGTYNGSTVKYYINGVLKGSGSLSGNVRATSTNHLIIGGRGYAANYFNGTIDSVAIYNRALTEQEIKDLYINWSGWSNYYDSSPTNLNYVNGMVFQYQARLNTTNNSITPTLDSVNITYNYPPPNVTLVYPADNAVLAGRVV